MTAAAGQRIRLASGAGVNPAAEGLTPGQGRTLHPAARNHWRLTPHLFSGFRPIANRGQQ